MADRDVVGRSVPRVDGVAKVTGAAKFTGDLTFPELTYGAVVRSTRAHARLIGIDASAARSADGVLGVVTAEALDGLTPYYGHIITDHPVLATDKTRFMGEPVALVVGTDPARAAAAARLVEVKYEDLPSATTLAQALASDAPQVHEGPGYGRGRGVFWETVPDAQRGNVAHVGGLEWGDVDAGLADADIVVESTAEYPMVYAYAMEPYVAVARYHGSTLEVSSSAQHPFAVREELAKIFGLPLSSVTVRVPYVGGGYGSKSWTKVEPLAAVGAWMTGRPVKVALTAEEAMLTTRADSAEVRVTSGFGFDGALVARDIEIDFNTGAYADSSPSILDKAVHRSFGPYRIPSLRVRGRLVYTNTVPASSYRGFGAPQVNAACEYNIDRAAALLGRDPGELRRRNLLSRGEEVLPGRRPLDADLAADLAMLTSALDEDASTARPATAAGVLRGVGFGCSVSDAGSFPSSTAIVKVLPDGSAMVVSGAVEMGQGSATVLSQITAHELQLPLERVRIVQSDTGATPLERTTNASRTTTLVGLAVQRACAHVLERLRSIASDMVEATSAAFEIDDGALRAPDGTRLGYGSIVEHWFGLGAGELIGVGEVRQRGDVEALPPFWEIGMSGVALAIDQSTGRVTVEHLATVGDVGKAINPTGAENQDLGAATQGLGAALHEQLVYDGGQLVNPNLVEYRVPRTTDIPGRLSLMLAERADGIGPYGAKGGGEGSLNPIGGAVASAVARAIGRWPERVQLPFTPERVWRLLREGAST